MTHQEHDRQMRLLAEPTSASMSTCLLELLRKVLVVEVVLPKNFILVASCCTLERECNEVAIMAYYTSPK